MIKKLLILILIIQTNLLVAVDIEPEIYSAIRGDVDFSNLTPAQRAQFLPQVNARGGLFGSDRYYGSPLGCAVWMGEKKAINWLLANGARVDKDNILERALYPVGSISSKIIETLLLHDAPTNIGVGGLILSIKIEIERLEMVGVGTSKIERYKKVRDMLTEHEKLKLRTTWIRGLVQMGRARDLQQRGAGAPAGTARAVSVEVVSQAGHTPVVITRAALQPHSVGCECCYLQ